MVTQLFESDLRVLAAQLRELSGIPTLEQLKDIPPQVHAAMKPAVGPPPSPSFQRQLTKVADFLAAEGRLPSAGPARPRDERNLGHWLYRRRFRLREGTLPPGEQHALERALGPDWHSTRVRRQEEDH